MKEKYTLTLCEKGSITLFHFLTPFIEQCGYQWQLNVKGDEAKIVIEKFKKNVKK